jgi:NADH-quinone oxidoreductase subunit C
MKPTLERLAEQFTELIGPEAFAKARAAQAAAAAAASAPKPVATAATPSSAMKPISPALDQSAGSSPTSSAKAGALLPASSGSTSAAVAPAVPRPTPAAPAPPPPPPLPVQTVAHAAKGYNLDAIVGPQQVVPAASILAGQGFALDAITGVDWPAQNEMEVVYDYFHPTEPLRVVVRTRVSRLTPELPTISSLYQGANWHEREAHDFFGLTFTGHPNLKPFLLPEDADFHPLRKDYTP